MKVFRRIVFKFSKEKSLINEHFLEAREKRIRAEKHWLFDRGLLELNHQEEDNKRELIGIETQFKNDELGLSRYEGERMSHK